MRAIQLLTIQTVGALALLCVFTAEAHALEPPLTPPKWDKESLNLFASIPTQDGGRVKPLDTFARFRLLQLSGRTRFPLDKDKRTALEWLLDCLFYPDVAPHYKVFLVESADVMDDLGLPHRKKRDRYSYHELEPGRQRLFSLAQQYAHIEEQDRAPVQRQIVNLAFNVREFETLTHYLEFARRPVPLGDSIALSKAFPGADAVPYSAILEKGPVLSGLIASLRTAPEGMDETRQTSELAALSVFLHKAEAVGGMATALALFPPSASTAERPEWLTPADMMASAFLPKKPLAEQIALLRALEELEQLKDDRARFHERLAQFHAGVRQLAESRGEYKRIPLEVTFYKAKFFQYGLMFYVLSFLLVAISWLRPHNRAMAVIAAVALTIPTALLICGITLRCIIRARPPVTTLYETILFITTVAVVVALIIELINRQKIAVSVGAFLGAVGLFLANKHEIKEAVDTMPSLVAVLDTNFWLATHVTTITMGYAAGLLAGAIAHIYILGRLIGFKRADPQFYKSVAQMTYGVICFGLLFSVLGTVLGGIWANDSWGRFWGWDPKENGALMIVLWKLTILHARMGGYIRDYGVSMAAIFGAVIVTFSWFGVNLLGVGLHSYGFTSGVFRVLVLFYIVEAVVLLVGSTVWLREKALSDSAPGRA